MRVSHGKTKERELRELKQKNKTRTSEHRRKEQHKLMGVVGIYRQISPLLSKNTSGTWLIRFLCAFSAKHWAKGKTYRDHVSRLKSCDRFTSHDALFSCPSLRTAQYRLMAPNPPLLGIDDGPLDGGTCSGERGFTIGLPAALKRNVRPCGPPPLPPRGIVTISLRSFT